MSDRKRKAVDIDSVGTPPKKVVGKSQTIRFIIYDFEKHPAERGEEVESRKLRAHGHSWKIRVYPRGEVETDEEKEYVSSYLEFAGSRKGCGPTVKFDLRCRGVKRSFDAYEYNGDGSTWGSVFWEREKILKDSLGTDGSLVIEADIWMCVDSKVWYPKELQREETLVTLYRNTPSETTDVTFTVGKTNYEAHSLILSMKARELFELSKEYKNDVPVPIPEIRREIFRSVLEFIYTVRTPNIKNMKIALEILFAANRFECTQLKLYAESVIVDKFLAVSNAADMLMFADSLSCALLKEAAINVYMSNAKRVRASQGWANVKESNRLLSELLEHTPLQTISVGVEYSYDDVDQMDVASLRDHLQDENYEIDGSRELLVKRLKEIKNISDLRNGIS